MLRQVCVDLRHGDIVSFVYAGGIICGATRVVKLEAIDQRGLCGTDLNKGLYHQYSFDKIGQLTLLRDGYEPSPSYKFGDLIKCIKNERGYYVMQIIKVAKGQINFLIIDVSNEPHPAGEPGEVWTNPKEVTDVYKIKQEELDKALDYFDKVEKVVS